MSSAVAGITESFVQSLIASQM